MNFLTDNAMMGPVLAQVGLTLIVMLLLFARRVPAMAAAKPSNEMMQDKKSLEMLPKPAQFASQNYNHQFEAPVLFYALTIGAMAAGIGGELAVMLAWAYVGLRIVHAAIHVTYNKVMHRFLVFALSSFVLIALFIVLLADYMG